MNMSIAFFAGCVTFVVMMVIKIPMKMVNKAIAGRFYKEKDKRMLLYRRLNVSIMIMAVLVSMLCYYVVAQFFMISNIKWCCAMKGGAIAIAMHTLYSQWFEAPKA